MTCIMHAAPAATTSVASTRAGSFFLSASPLHRNAAEVHPVLMNWVVISDTRGNRHLQMHWSVR